MYAKKYLINVTSLYRNKRRLICLEVRVQAEQTTYERNHCEMTNWVCMTRNGLKINRAWGKTLTKQSMRIRAIFVVLSFNHTR